MPASTATAASIQLFTIGVYGSSADEFFAKLLASHITLFCDLRRRRGVRGAQYAYANSQRLQARLRELGIAYVYLPGLAPTLATSAHQKAADQAHAVAKRKRQVLSPAFVTDYAATTLASFEAATFLASLPPGPARLALFCVEGPAAACHRSLVAARLANELGTTVTHL